MSIDVSVIIPTFRRPVLLPQAVKSVLLQPGVTVEVFVVDDCPDGSARDVVEQHPDPRVTYIRNPHPTGGWPSIVRNLGWQQARGTYLHFLDDDDIVPDGHYAAMLDLFARVPKVGMVFGRIEPFGDCPPEQLERERVFFASAARYAARCNRLGARFGFTGWTLFGSALLVCGAALLRRERIAALGGFDPAIRLWEDTELFLRVMRDYGARYTDRVTLHYRIGSPSLLHDPNPPPERLEAERHSARQIWSKYRAQHGQVEFLALAGLTRAILKPLF